MLHRQDLSSLVSMLVISLADREITPLRSFGLMPTEHHKFGGQRARSLGRESGLQCMKMNMLIGKIR
jgi:hypothetical protein